MPRIGILWSGSCLLLCLAIAVTAPAQHRKYSAYAAARNSKPGRYQHLPPQPLSAAAIRKNTITVKAPIACCEKSVHDSLVYWGEYFFGFVTDSSYQELKSQADYWDANAVLESSARPDIAIRPEGRVNDYERVFTPAEVKTLEDTIAGFEQLLNGRLAIITIDSSWVKRGQLDSLAAALNRDWERAFTDRNQRHACLLVSVGYKTAVLVNGTGIQKKIPEGGRAQLYAQTIMPAFANRHYYDGVAAALQEVIRLLR